MLPPSEELLLVEEELEDVDEDPDEPPESFDEDEVLSFEADLAAGSAGVVLDEDLPFERLSVL